MADGRVVIDTKIDTTGIEKGIRTISTLLKTDLASRALGVLKDAVSFISDETGKLNESIRMASTLFGDYNVNIDELARNLRTLSNETQVAASELGMGLYNALSSGVPGSDSMAEALEFVRKNALAAKAGMAELDPTIRATASVMNSYGLTVADTDRILGVMMNTQNLGITTIRELSTTLAQVIPTAASFGVSFEQVGAALATMTAMGTQTAQATTGLNSMLAELGKQGQQAYENLGDAAEGAGLGRKNFQELTKEGYSLGDVLKLMADHAERNGKNLIDMFGSVEAGRAAMQLTTNDGEKFVTFLESMYHTEGMVETASKTVMTETQRLETAIRNAASTVGNKFLPAWNGIAGILADTVTSLSGNRDTAGELKTALENLETATQNYKKAQDDAKNSTDELTLSMRDQSATALRNAAREYVKAYETAVADIEDAEYNLKTASHELNTIEINNKALNEMAERLTGIKDNAIAAREELARMAAAGELKNSDFNTYSDLVAALNDSQEIVDGYLLQLEKARDVQNNAIAELVEGYSEGIIEISAFRDANYDLYSTIVKLSGAYEEGYASQEAFLNTDNFSEFADEELKRLEDLREEVEEGSSKWYVYSGAIAAVTTKMRALGIAANELEVKPKVEGGGTSTQGTSTSGTSSSGTGNRYTDLEKSFNDSVTLSKVSDDFDRLEMQISKTKASIKELVEDYGMDENSEEVQFHMMLLADLEKQVEKTRAAAEAAAQGTADDNRTITDTLRDIGSIMQDTFSFESMYGVLQSSVQALVDTLSGAKERINELTEEISESESELLELEEELADAQARRDEDAIEALEEQIDAKKKIIETNKEEKESLESGAEGWKAFGKVALQALAEVLYGLGAQLAAQAVLEMVKGNLGGAGLAAGGSVAALAAGAAVDYAAGSFEKGGIVPPVAGVNSYSGDNLIARVNAGELILNRAQQENLSGYLASLEAQRTMVAPQGPSITVNMQGAYIYGLNEPAVGKAIYDNIRTLQMEGVIR